MLIENESYWLAMIGLYIPSNQSIDKFIQTNVANPAVENDRPAGWLEYECKDMETYVIKHIQLIH